MNYMNKGIGTLVAAIATISTASSVTLVWDFEGGGTGTLADTTGSLAFASTVDPVANSTAWAVGAIGETQAINYAGLPTIDGEHNNRAGDNNWFLRSDHAFDGTTLTKPGDGSTGILQSDTFMIEVNSEISFLLGGGNTGGSFVLRDANDDSVILSADPAANGHINRTGANAQTDDGLQTWTGADLTGAGVTGTTSVYFTVEDDSTGGWGHVQLDDVTVTNATIPEPTASALGLLGLMALFGLRRRG